MQLWNNINFAQFLKPNDAVRKEKWAKNPTTSGIKQKAPSNSARIEAGDYKNVTELLPDILGNKDNQPMMAQLKQDINEGHCQES